MFGRLLDLFRGALPPAIAKAESPLTQADRQAVLADLSYADAAEAGLGEALATYVVTGEGSTALLRIETLLNAGVTPGRAAIWTALQPPPYPYGDEKAQQERQLEARRRALFGLEGWDPSAMRRYGQLLAVPHAAAPNRYGFPGSDRSPLWFRSLLDAARTYHPADSAGGGAGFLTIPRLRAMLASDPERSGAPAAALVDCAFSGAYPLSFQSGTTLQQFDGLADALAEEADAVPAAVRALAAPGRATMLAFIAQSGLPARSPVFAELLFGLAADGAKAVRDAALAALRSLPAEAVRTRTAGMLASRSADERLAAVHVLASRFGADALPALTEHEAAETAKKVREAIATARATVAAVAQAHEAEAPEDSGAGYVAIDGSYVPAPPREAPSPASVPSDVEGALRTLMLAANGAARQDYDAVPTAERGKAWGTPARFEAPFDPRIARQVVAVMGGSLRPDKADAAAWRSVSVWLPTYCSGAAKIYRPGLRALLDRPDVPLAALVRLCLLYQGPFAWGFTLGNLLQGTQHGSEPEQAVGRRIAAGADLRDIVAVAEAAGRSTPEALEQTLGRWWTVEEGDDRNPTIWPVLAAHFAVLDKALAPDAAARNRHVAEAVVTVLRLFPLLPRRYFRNLLDQATSGNKRTRTRARAMLGGAGDLLPVIGDMLRSSEASRRVGGARWLADRRDPAAVSLLRTALAGERNEAAKAAIVSALAACGDDVSDQFSEERLLAEARAGLPKTKVDYSALFDADRLPALRWADHRPVPPEVVRWWFARAHKLKQPGGDPLLHLALDQLDRGDAARLGQDVLAAFVQYDTRHPSPEEASAYAQANAPNWQTTYIGYRRAENEDEAFAFLRRAKLSEYLGNALDHRGLLALARHAPAAAAVAMVKRYFRDHGSRANQCRALVDMLAANPAPAALQLILATSQRHKQPGTRKHAGEVVAAIAEDRGWTPAELADRTIPSAGLDDDGVLELPVGERAYRARIAEAKAGGKGKKVAPGLTLVIENPDGKPVSALPTPSDPAEAEAAKEAKKALSAAKKELAQTVELQTARLYEAMCAGRTWPVMEFRAYLLDHPVVGRLLRRVVLAGFDADGRLVTGFRALDDGSFTDAADMPVGLDAFQDVGIAHAVVLGADAAASWATHLRDYEVEPLFEQLHRPLLAPADAAGTEITDRTGWMIDTFALRAVAAGLGYQRGPVEDGGCFYSYDKPFPELGIAARLAFTGSFVPESEQRPGALKALGFVRLRPGDTSGWGRGALAVGKVPPILLSEAWNDLHVIAAQGTGFDPEWEKKAGW